MRLRILPCSLGNKWNEYQVSKYDFHFYDYHFFIHDLIEQAINFNFMIVLGKQLRFKKLKWFFLTCIALFLIVLDLQTPILEEKKHKCTNGLARSLEDCR
jgi:hypothetical protein